MKRVLAAILTIWMLFGMAILVSAVSVNKENIVLPPDMVPEQTVWEQFVSQIKALFENFGFYIKMFFSNIWYTIKTSILLYKQIVNG